MCMYQFQSPSIYPTTPGNHKIIFYICDSMFLKFVPFFLDSTYKRYHMISVFLSVTCFTEYDTL